MVGVLTVPANRNNRSNMDNVNQLIARELCCTCSIMNTRLRNHCQNMGFEEYPYIMTKRATPQQMRGWLLYHFPDQFYKGRVERGVCAGHRDNRGVEHTTNGYFADVAGMRKF